MRSSVFCIVLADEIRAALRALKASGILERDVSVLCSDVPTLESAYRDQEGGMLPNATCLIVSGIGPSVVSGPVARMLVGTPAGEFVGGLTVVPEDLGRLIGIPDSDLARFKDQLGDGRGIILVHYDSPEDQTAARTAFERLGVTGIGGTGPAARSVGARGTSAEPTS